MRRRDMAIDGLREDDEVTNSTHRLANNVISLDVQDLIYKFESQEGGVHSHFVEVVT